MEMVAREGRKYPARRAIVTADGRHVTYKSGLGRFRGNLRPVGSVKRDVPAATVCPTILTRFAEHECLQRG